MAFLSSAKLSHRTVPGNPCYKDHAMIDGFDWPSFRPPLETYKLDYGIGIVGYAGIVRAQQLPAYRLAGYRVVAASDRQAARRELASRDGIPHVYADFRELLARDDIQIIDCAVDHTPSAIAGRVQILKDAAKAGKAVLMQKPMATDLKTAEEMVHIAEDGGIPFAVNQNLRFDPAIYSTKQFLAPQRFGNPGFIQFANISAEGPKFGFGPEAVVMAWQIHAIDSIRWLAGGDPVCVYCTNRNYASMYQLVFSSGAVCDYFSTTMNTTSGTKHRCGFGRRRARSATITAGIRVRTGSRT